MANYRIPSDYKNDVPRYSHRWRSPVKGTIHPGLAYPLKHRHLDVGDRVRCNPAVLVQSQPMLGPLMDGFKLVTIATFTPDSAFYGWLSTGVRYTPQEYLEFKHWMFNPCALGFGFEDREPLSEEFMKYTDPSVSDGSVQESLAYMGLGMSSEGFEGWKNDSAWTVNASGDFVFSSGYQYHIGRGSLWNLLGVPAGAVPPLLKGSRSESEGLYKVPTSFSWRLEPALSYFLSCYYYFANMQEEFMYFTRSAVLYKPGSALTFRDVFLGLDPSEAVRSIASLRNYSLDKEYWNYPCSGGAGAGVLSDGLIAMLTLGCYAHGGFLSVPYSPDLFNNIIKLGESPSVTLPVISDPDGDSSAVAIPDLRLKTKIQSMMDRLFVSGGRVDDVFKSLWGSSRSRSPIDKPRLLGVWQSSINPSNVVAQASGSAEGEDLPAGQMVSRFDKFSDFENSSGIDFTASEPGTIMFITALVPEPSYAQGVDPGLVGESFADDFNPEMNGMGFVSVARHRYSMLPSASDGEQRSAYSVATGSVGSYMPGANIDPNDIALGDVVSWDYYKTDYPRLFGEFATNGYFQYWTLVRRYTQEYFPAGTSLDTVLRNLDSYSTYVNPLDWQYLFTAQTLFDPNFFVAAYFDINVVNKVSSSYMPYMGK